jgi:KaiC/GvpD/RAD55 family RecA-like ATPase
MSDVKPEAVSFLWPGRIAAGKITIVCGDPGLGKSFISLDIAARVSNGAEWPDAGVAPRGSVVLLTAEDGLSDTVRPRLDTLGADVTRIHALTAVRRAGEHGERSFSLAEDVLRLETAIRQTGAALVVIDPLNAYLQNVDSHRAAEVRGVLAPLAAMAERSACAVLIVHHLNKGTSANALYRAGGSLDFVAAARSVLGVAVDSADSEGQRRLLLSIKLNVAAKPPGIGFSIAADGVAWDDEPVAVDADAAFSSASRDAEDDGALSEAKDFLSDLLGDGTSFATRSVLQQAREAGIAEKTLRRAKKVLGIAVTKAGFGKTGEWCWVWPGPKVAKDSKDGQQNDVGTLGDAGHLSSDEVNEPDRLLLVPLKMANSPKMANVSSMTTFDDRTHRNECGEPPLADDAGGELDDPDDAASPGDYRGADHRRGGAENVLPTAAEHKLPDDLFARAVGVVATVGAASTSLISRRCDCTPDEAAMVLVALERAKVIAPATGGRAQDVLIDAGDVPRFVAADMAQCQRAYGDSATVVDL